METYLWEHFPEYAVGHNALEMSGDGGADIPEGLLKALGAESSGMDEKRERRAKTCITYSEELAGQEPLLLP